MASGGLACARPGQAVVVMSVAKSCSLKLLVPGWRLSCKESSAFPKAGHLGSPLPGVKKGPPPGLYCTFRQDLPQPHHTQGPLGEGGAQLGARPACPAGAPPGPGSTAPPGATRPGRSVCPGSEASSVPGKGCLCPSRAKAGQGLKAWAGGCGRLQPCLGAVLWDRGNLGLGGLAC